MEDINARLDQRFRLLTSGSRTALPRQQTLRSLIDWSYDLLNDDEKRLLNRVSVFSGGWTLEAAEGVCSETNPQAPIPATFAQLTAKGSNMPKPRSECALARRSSSEDQGRRGWG